MRRLVTTFLPLVGIMLACDQTSEPLAPTEPTAQFDIYIGTDPCPSCEGIFVGEPYTDETCAMGASGPNGDLDMDGLADGCEERIAAAFAPELRLSATDPEPSREPYWAARLDGAGVRIFYALSYHKDGGAYGFGCPQCTAHFGDSEWISLYVEYNPTTKHWLLTTSTYSQHYGAFQYLWYDMEYPSGISRSYPRSWVAWGKHANYASEAACDAGAGGYDDCPGNSVTSRVPTSRFRNLGSSHRQRVDCVRSTVLASTYSECFWSGTMFTGWWGVPEDPYVTPYRTHLADQGFIVGIE